MDIKARGENMKKFFDQKVEGYDDVHAKYAETKALLTEVLPEGCSKILDLGAGTGMELVPLYERFPNAAVTAVDISAPMLEALKARDFADKVTAICGDFFEVDFGSEFEAVISTSSLHHFDEDIKVLLYKKIYDSLVPGGIFANSDKICDTQEEQDEWMGYWYNSPDMRKHIDTPLTPENEVKLLKLAGFTDITVSPTDAEDYRLFLAKK